MDDHARHLERAIFPTNSDPRAAANHGIAPCQKHEVRRTTLECWLAYARLRMRPDQSHLGVDPWWIWYGRASPSRIFEHEKRTAKTARPLRAGPHTDDLYRQFAQYMYLLRCHKMMPIIVEQR